MGLPAFDMSAFDVAREAVAARPIASTTIFSAAPLDRRASVDELRETVRKSTDEIIASYVDWRARALVGVANLRSLLGHAAAHLPSSMLDEVLSRNIEQIEDLKISFSEYKEFDRVAISDAYDNLKQYEFLQSDLKKFFRHEIRRVEKMAADRAASYERIIATLTEISLKLRDYIEKNTLPSAKNLHADELSTHLDQALLHKPDLEGVAERTARRLRNFPKVAGYLGR